MNKPVRTTLIFGFLCGLAMIPAFWHDRYHGAWPLAYGLAAWCILAAYSLLLCRWSRTPITAVFFPLALVLGLTAWPGKHDGLLLTAMVSLSWIRSGICFKHAPMNRLLAEVVTAVGASVLIASWWPQSTASWALPVWIFFLVQSIYFFFMPTNQQSGERHKYKDNFDMARREAERLLETS